MQSGSDTFLLKGKFCPYSIIVPFNAPNSMSVTLKCSEFHIKKKFNGKSGLRLEGHQNSVGSMYLIERTCFEVVVHERKKCHMWIGMA